VKTVPFNINDTVRVKLTPYGRAMHRKAHEDLMQHTRRLGYPDPFPYVSVKEDKRGWSEWQLWHLMQIFGPHIYHGCKNCFDMTIIIVLDEEG